MASGIHCARYAPDRSRLAGVGYGRGEGFRCSDGGAAVQTRGQGPARVVFTSEWQCPVSDEELAAGGELGAATRAALRALGRPRWYAPGETLMLHGSVADMVMLIERGLVKVAVATDDGRTTVLAYRGAGEMIGEMGVIGRVPRSATVVAVDRVRVWVIPASVFLSEVRNRPEVAADIMSALVARLRDADRERVLGPMTPARVRIARKLLDLVEWRGRSIADGAVIEIWLTQQDLAAAAGVGLRSASRELPELRSRGLIDYSRGRFTVLDPAGLARVANELKRPE
ncbi:Crp/Fnr family transcriptional regulator [Frankia sp. CiP1_Cm_nod2]|uniref:Crp/Fnr family transcriptional regulator n=1 Tax=Frankia sp. CiP1_Cm_nod2 TaxID=2897161 RepID=UPI004043BEEC